MAGRWRPIGQHREALLAWTAEAPANPDLLVPLVVGLFKPPSVTNDCPVTAKTGTPWVATRARSRSPRVDLAFRFWQCDKKNHGWREGRH